MLFFVFIITLVVGFVIWCFCDSELAGGAISVLGAIGITISLCVISMNYIGVDGYVNQMNARHEVLVYQYENDIYDNDNDIGKRELMLEIQDWNEDLARHQANQDDFWVGIYVPNIYDQFEFVALEKGVSNAG